MQVHQRLPLVDEASRCNTDGRRADIILEGLLDPLGIADHDIPVLKTVWNEISNIQPKGLIGTYGVFLQGVENADGGVHIHYKLRPLRTEVQVRGKTRSLPFSLSSPIIDASDGWKRLVAHKGPDGKPMLPGGSTF